MSAKAKFVFQPISFIVAFAIGILYVYMMAPKPKVIYKYPTPYNVQSTTYKDLSGECFKYTATKVDCKSVDSKTLIDQPIQK